jgi:hypothetical protein
MHYGPQALDQGKDLRRGVIIDREHEDGGIAANQALIAQSKL